MLHLTKFTEAFRGTQKTNSNHAQMPDNQQLTPPPHLERI